MHVYHNQGCRQDLTSWGGLGGGTYIVICDIKERLENIGAEPHYLLVAIFSRALCRTAPAGDSPGHNAITLVHHKSQYIIISRGNQQRFSEKI